MEKFNAAVQAVVVWFQSHGIEGSFVVGLILGMLIVAVVF